MNFWGGEWRRDKLHLNTMALTLPNNCSNECINEKVIFSILKPCFSCKYVKTIHLCTENSLLNLFQIFWKSQGIGLFLHNYIHTLAGHIYILIFSLLLYKYTWSQIQIILFVLFLRNLTCHYSHFSRTYTIFLFYQNCFAFCCNFPSIQVCNEII